MLASKLVWHCLLTAPMVLGATLSTLVLTALETNANEAIVQQSSAESSTLNQIEVYRNGYVSGTVPVIVVNTANQATSVSQLADVQPTDWAFQALQSLVERYGCIVGYPDGTYRGNRPLSRYEFAAGLNACMDKINELIANGTADLASREDLEALQRLQNEFAGELATLRARVDSLEGRTAQLEAQQFSTTTKLSGEVIFTLADTFGNRTGGNTDPTQTIFAYRARLNFNTSFAGNDLLRVRLQALNVTPFNQGVTGTDMTRLSFDGTTTPANNFQIDDLLYRFSIGPNTRVWALLNGFGTENITPSLNPLESDGQSAISRFARFSPTYRSVSGSGVGFAHKFSDEIELSGAYRSTTASNPAAGNGIFNGNYGAIAQLTVTPVKGIRFGIHYAHGYFPGTAVNLTGGVGSAFAQQPFGAVPTRTDTYGGVASFQISPSFILSGWVGYTNATASGGVNQGATASVLNWMVTLAFPDLGGKGNMGGISVGMPPKVTDNQVGSRTDRDTSIHVETFYRYRLSDNISITPGVFVIFNPEHNSANNTQFVGLVRTTFSF